MRLAIALVVLLASTADAQVSVRGYVRRDGVYVSPYYRSAPDAYRFNNYSYSRGPSYRSYYAPTYPSYGYGYGGYDYRAHSGFGSDYSYGIPWRTLPNY